MDLQSNEGTEFIKAIEEYGLGCFNVIQKLKPVFDISVLVS